MCTNEERRRTSNEKNAWEKWLLSGNVDDVEKVALFSIAMMCVSQCTPPLVHQTSYLIHGSTTIRKEAFLSLWRNHDFPLHPPCFDSNSGAVVLSFFHDVRNK